MMKEERMSSLAASGRNDFADDSAIHLERTDDPPIGAPVIAYPPEAVLEIAHVAAWLRVSERTIERLDIPFTLLGKRTKRYLARDVLEYLAKRRVA